MNKFFTKISNHFNKYKKNYYTIIGIVTISTMGIYVRKKMIITLPKTYKINH